MSAPTACRSKPAPSPVVAPDAGRTTVSVDPALLASGRIQLAAVERRPPRGELRVAAEVQSSESGVAEVGALVPGRVASLEVGEGSRVKRGQVLAWIDAPEVAHATADVLRARARAGLTSRRLERQRELAALDATSRSALEDALAEDTAARIDLAAASTLLESLGGREPPADPEARAAVVLARAPIRSPIDGVVASHDAVLGASVAADRTLFRIVAEKELVVLARLPETSHVPVSGTFAAIQPRDGHAPCGATVRGDVGMIDESTRTLALRLEPDPGCRGLVAGGYVDAVLPLVPAAGGAPALVVPREAIVDVQGVPCVFAGTDRPGTYRVRPVRVGAGEGGDAIVESGVDEGESIVVGGALLLKGELLRGELGGA